MFCLYFNCIPLPVTLQLLSMYAQFLSRSFKSIISVKNYVHGVKVLHLQLNVDFPELDYSYQMLMKGLARLNPHEQTQALPITPELLSQLHSVMDLNESLDRALWSCFLLTFYLFARKSNMVPPSGSSYNNRKHLARGDIHVSDSGLIILLKWSKTIQLGERHLLVPVIEIPSSVLCPKTAYLRMVSNLPAASGSPAFLFVNKLGLVETLTHSMFVNNLRGFLLKAGVNCLGFSGHSFRRGGATCAFAAGVPGELVQLHGDWRSDAYLRYLSIPMQQKLSVTQRMRTFILSGSVVE